MTALTRNITVLCHANPKDNAYISSEIEDLEACVVAGFQ